MYDNEYEEYMRAVLGYPQTDNTYYSRPFFPYNNNIQGNNNIEKYENYYPEIYRILKPMVSKVCNTCRNHSITNELVESMTMEVYNNIESDQTLVNLNITTIPNARTNSKVEKNMNPSNEGEQRGCTQCNPLLKDLIKILIINQLIGNNKPPRPHRPPMMPYPPQNGPWPM